MKNINDKVQIITRPIDHKYPDFMNIVESEAIVLPKYRQVINIFYLSNRLFK